MCRSAWRCVFTEETCPRGRGHGTQSFSQQACPRRRGHGTQILPSKHAHADVGMAHKFFPASMATRTWAWHTRVCKAVGNGCSAQLPVRLGSPDLPGACVRGGKLFNGQ